MNRLRNSAWQYVAEVLHSEELPMLAAHALVDGHDSPALRELAGLPRRSDASEVRELYVQALHELDVPLPDDETAGRYLLVSLAFGLAEGELGPREVTDRLGMTVTALTEEEARFLSVAADYSEWLGPEHLPGWERDLRTAAHSLAASTDLAPGIGRPDICERPDQPAWGSLACRRYGPEHQRPERELMPHRQTGNR
ncbi:hypothetical protein OHB05_37675 [Streptomyces sp. NBC_00638]|uniref:hypothetical protein n=1 Tax=unclassified Streptomyces TaxID=2593676 RepID=UPI0022525079|nr:hypothetical protein [Streptomyces sp. NBC_00638]MCX5008304.1 hypothetical protein [Streptomyces sp. NBC_00638]